ncbi:MAG: hypothetical protein ABR535_00950 [Pyrinomonadaceae bacterium]
MPSKFDTNPLDPTFPEKVRAATANIKAETQAAPEMPVAPTTRFKTSEFPSEPSSVTEEETRLFGEREFQAYSMPSGAAVPAAYQSTSFGAIGIGHGKKTALPEKWLIGLPYVPFHVGLIAGLILLLIIPKEETKVRFHAAQGLAAQVGILIVTSILGLADNVSDLAGVAGAIFAVVATVMLGIFAIKAWQGKGVHIESVEQLTNWLEEKIGPMNKS